jgi:hypothetical protein
MNTIAPPQLTRLIGPWSLQRESSWAQSATCSFQQARDCRFSAFSVPPYWPCRAAFFALAERGDFPSRLTRVHPRFRTPYISILVFALPAWAASSTSQRCALPYPRYAGDGRKRPHSAFPQARCYLAVVSRSAPCF